MEETVVGNNLVCPWCGCDRLTVTTDIPFNSYRVKCPRCGHDTVLTKGDSMREWANYCLDVIKRHVKYPPTMAVVLKEELEKCDTIENISPVNLINIMRKYKYILEAGKMCEPAEEKKEDVVNHPSHYETGKYECIEVMVEAIGATKVMDFCLCNAFKYLYRCGRKNGVEDIKKARWYLNKYLELWEDFGDEDN